MREMKIAIVDNDRNKLITAHAENLQKLETKFGSYFRDGDKVSPWGMVCFCTHSQVSSFIAKDHKTIS